MRRRYEAAKRTPSELIKWMLDQAGEALVPQTEVVDALLDLRRPVPGSVLRIDAALSRWRYATVVKGSELSDLALDLLADTLPGLDTSTQTHLRGGAIGEGKSNYL